MNRTSTHSEPQGDAILEQPAFACTLARCGAGYNKFVPSRRRRDRGRARADPWKCGGAPKKSARAGRHQGCRDSRSFRASGPTAAWGSVLDYHDTLTAGVAEVSVDQATGKIKVHNYWVAIDGGLIIQPDNVNAQLESAVVYALSGALSEELTVKDGAVQQSNFNDYHVLRMSDMPQIHMKVIVTDNPPTGMGEVGIPCVAPAIGNAVAQLTGKRLRHLPMSAERGKKAWRRRA